MKDNTLKSGLAEFFGTFTLVFIGALSGALAGVSAGGLVGVAVAHGFALLVIVYAWGSISGAHVNPAVTLGVLVTGRIGVLKAVVYRVAQFLGAAAAAILIRYLLEGLVVGLGETTGVLTPLGPDKPGDPVKVIVVEGVLTFFLVVAVFASGIFGRNGNVAGIAIGLVLTMDILAGGYLTGASMNPARTFGPALAAADFSYLWMYLVGPFAGGVVALVYEKIFLPAVLQPPVEAADDTLDKHRR